MNLADLYLTPREKYEDQQHYHCSRCHTTHTTSRDELKEIDNHPTMLCGGIMRIPIPILTNTMPVEIREHDTHIRVTNFCKNCADTL